MAYRRFEWGKDAKQVALFAVGLALLDIWGDMKGAAPILVDFNGLVQSTLVNGRMVGLFGIALCCLFAALKPREFVRGMKAAVVAVPLLAAALSVCFCGFFLVGQDFGAVAVSAVFLAGLCYGWFEVALIGGLAGCGLSAASLVFVLIASLGAKGLAVPLVGCLPDFAQAVVFAGAPLAMGALVWRGGFWRSSQWGDEEPGAAGSRFSDMAVLILLMFSALAASTRGIGALGFWGSTGVMSFGQVGSAVLSVVVFLAVSYLSFAGKKIEGFISVSIRLLSVLLGCILVMGSGVADHFAMPAYLSSALDIFTDLFAVFLVRIAMVVTARTSRIHPFAVVGLAECLCCAISIVYGLALTLAPDLRGFVVMLSAFGTAIVALLMLEKTVVRIDEHGGADALGESCARLVREYELTPREGEVLELLAQGRSQTYIAEELVLAPSTVKTHVKRIYRKIGINSKQELISMIRQNR